MKADYHARVGVITQGCEPWRLGFEACCCFAVTASQFVIVNDLTLV